MRSLSRSARRDDSLTRVGLYEQINPWQYICCNPRLVISSLWTSGTTGLCLSNGGCDLCRPETPEENSVPLLLPPRDPRSFVCGCISLCVIQQPHSTYFWTASKKIYHCLFFSASLLPLHKVTLHTLLNSDVQVELLSFSRYALCKKKNNLLSTRLVHANAPSPIQQTLLNCGKLLVSTWWMPSAHERNWRPQLLYFHLLGKFNAQTISVKRRSTLRRDWRGKRKRKETANLTQWAVTDAKY